MLSYPAAFTRSTVVALGRMVRLLNGRVGDCELEQAVRAPKNVDPQGEMVRAARALGVAFGDET